MHWIHWFTTCVVGRCHQFHHCQCYATFVARSNIKTFRLLTAVGTIHFMRTYMMSAKWILLGIAGVTNGGKSTLAKRLHEDFCGSIYINQDKFFREEDDSNHIIIPELNHANWEALASINWDLLMARINTILATPPINGNRFVIVEGHLILNYEPLAKLFHKKYFFTLTKEECWERRRRRVYDPKDPPGYFDACVWPMYLKNKKEMEEKIKDIVYIDGTRGQEEIYQEILEDLKNNFSVTDNMQS